MPTQSNMRNRLLIDDLSKELPPVIRHAALCLANEDDSNLPDRDIYTLLDALVDSFGDRPLGSVNHRRVAWLCVHACELVSPLWFGLDNELPQENLRTLRRYLMGEETKPDWERLCARGEVEPSVPGALACPADIYYDIAEAVAYTGEYCHQGNPRAAGEALEAVQSAIEQGIVIASDDCLGSFELWTCFYGLPAAWRCASVIAQNRSSQSTRQID